MKKIRFLSIMTIITLIALSISFWWNNTTSWNPHLAIIPHFMLASEKVDQFYAFLKNKRYPNNDPETIIIIAPNHFNQHSTTPQTICTPSEVYFNNQKYQLNPFPKVSCDENIFYPFGNVITTKEHGIGEHLPRITKYFPKTKQIIPLILPTHRNPTSFWTPYSLRGEESSLHSLISSSRSEEVLIIASVDFSHYLPEATAQANDQISIQTLQNWTWNRWDFRWLDVDCPSCLYLVNEIAIHKQSAQLYYRDSSSTILWKDMQSENTSRVFMYYEPYEQ